MKQGDHLWRLVYFMDKAEARHFRLFSQMQSGKKQYEYLYDEVNKVGKLEDYDEGLIRERLDRRGKIPARSFAVTKKYLFDTLLKSLRLLHEDRTVESRIRKQYEEASLLFQRGIMDKSQAHIREAKKQAVQYECFSVLLDLIDLEISHELLSLKRAKDPFSRIEALHREKEAVLGKLAQESEANKLRDLVFGLYRTANTQMGQKQARQLRDLKKQAFLKEPGGFTSFRSELFFHHSWGLIHTIENINPQQVFYHYRKMLEIWDKYLLFQKEYTRLYQVYLFGYLGTCHSFRDYSEFEAVLQKAEKLKPRTIFDQTSSFQDTSHYRQLFLMNTCRHEDALRFVKELDEKISWFRRRRYPLREDKLITLYYNISILLFVNERFDETMERLEKIRRELRDSQARLDVQYFTRILELLILFEKGEHDKLDHKEPYVKKLLMANDMLSEFDETVLGYIRKLNKGDTSSEAKALYQGLLDYIEASEKKFRKIRGREEVKIWAKSKLTGRPMTELMREQE